MALWAMKRVQAAERLVAEARKPRGRPDSSVAPALGGQTAGPPARHPRFAVGR
jgi:hypothetical protein